MNRQELIAELDRIRQLAVAGRDFPLLASRLADLVHAICPSALYDWTGE